jgi:hypothetical protein
MLLLLGCLATPTAAHADSIPWEIKNHPSPCLEHKSRCQPGKVLGQYDAIICEVLVTNCALHAQGKYHPEDVKREIRLVRLDHEPDACWKYRQDDCLNCVVSCGVCSDLSTQCKDQLYLKWAKEAQTDGQVMLVPTKVRHKSTPAAAKPAAKKPYKKTLIPKKKKYPSKRR